LPDVRRILVAGAATLAAALGAEGLVRLVLPQPLGWMNIFRRHPRQPMYALAAGADAVAENGETRWRVRTDEHGRRVPLRPLGAAPAPAPRLAFLGDSFTFGTGVDYRVSFVGRLAAGLRDRLDVINAAVPGYGPREYRLQLEDLLASPDAPAAVALVVYAGNDVWDAMVDKDIWPEEGGVEDVSSLRAQLHVHSHLYRLASNTYHRLWERSPYFIHDSRALMEPATWDTPHVAEGYRRARAELAAIAAKCRAAGVALFVGILPPTAAVDAHAGRPSAADRDLDYSLPVRRFSEALAELEVEHLDLTPALARRPARESFLAFDGHLSPAGHAVVAEALAAAWSWLRADASEATSRRRPP
jgi:lysophospholipase L1-like esterase